MLGLAWATLVGLATGIAITLAFIDADVAIRLKNAYLACPLSSNEAPPP
ncbi:MAG: hypothetical protein ACKVP7_12110 [Hyphomicrobiaceae bacterium]